MTNRRIYLVRQLSFTCGGCDDQVHLTNAPSNRELLCDRCLFWGVRSHLALRKLNIEVRAVLALGPQGEHR